MADHCETTSYDKYDAKNERLKQLALIFHVYTSVVNYNSMVAHFLLYVTDLIYTGNIDE